MLKALYNQMEIRLSVKPAGPLLVKERSPRDDEAGKKMLNERKERAKNMLGIKEPGMLFIRIARRDEKGNPRLEPYIPGSSLKGVLRSHAERIARTLDPEGCCDPLSDGTGPWAQPARFPKGCSLILKEKHGGKNPGGPTSYRESCPICRLFGNSFLRGRLEADDAYLAGGTGDVMQSPGPLDSDPGATTPWWWRKDAWNVSHSGYLGIRTCVSIDRFTGGVCQGLGPFKHECLEEGAFEAALRVRNFEIWQVGLVAFLLRDLRNRELRLGYGKRRGMGLVDVSVEGIEVTYYGKEFPARGELWGIGKVLPDTNGYGVREDDSLAVDGIEEKAQEDLIYRRTYRYDPQEFEQAWRAAAAKWVDFIKAGGGKEPTG